MLTLPKPSPSVIDAIRKLPRREAMVVQLVYRGLNERQICESLGMKRSTANATKRRAAARIRQMVGMVDHA